jgi:hypothetical protein
MMKAFRRGEDSLETVLEHLNRDISPARAWQAATERFPLIARRGPPSIATYFSTRINDKELADAQYATHLMSPFHSFASAGPLRACGPDLPESER